MWFKENIPQHRTSLTVDDLRLLISRFVDCSSPYFCTELPAFTSYLRNYLDVCYIGFTQLCLSKCTSIPVCVLCCGFLIIILLQKGSISVALTLKTFMLL